MNYSENEECVVVHKSSSPGMRVEPHVYVHGTYRDKFLSEDEALKQICNVAKLPGILQVAGLPDIHGGYDFPVGCAAAIDIDHPEAVISPGGVGHDINCGVRTVATNLDYASLQERKGELADELFRQVPSGMGNKGHKLTLMDLNTILDKGVSGLHELGLCDDDPLYIEDGGRVDADSRVLSQKCKGRGLSQLGSLGSGNHYLEIQKVAEIHDREVAAAFGVHRTGQIVYTVHTGSRGLGHEIYLEYPEDLGMGSVRAKSYLKALGCAANFAWANRSVISRKTNDVIRSFFPVAEFKLVYDVSHNIAKMENIVHEGAVRRCLVQRKGASRAFCDRLPPEYGSNQPVPVGGSMGTCSYILAGMEESTRKTAGSCCHGAGRLYTRGQARRTWSADDVLEDMRDIEVRYGTAKGLVEESPRAYKDITSVVDHCERVGIARKICKVVPVVVIKD